MKTSLATTLLAAALAVAVLPACTVARDQQTVGSYIDDTTLTTRVKARFAEDPQVSAMAISVETMKGVVQLSGFAKSAEERAAAERIAKGVPGVAAVRNDIMVSG
ncbi:MAG: BON domain-containing protein [Rubrivivax sp.]|nr:BON domain-containing protein [Rubrivivax sp.]MCW5609490.1 BON domain-containing protein [Rubrivivax sp.]